MDEIVKAALRKWPTVPHCYGWLALDARGDWYLRDERGAGGRAVSAGQGQPHRTRGPARLHRAQLRGRCARLLVLPERAAAGVRRTRGRALGLRLDAARARRGRRPAHQHTGRPQRGLPQRLARRTGPAVSRLRHRLRPGAQPGHRPGRAGHREPATGRRARWHSRTCRRASAMCCARRTSPRRLPVESLTERGIRRGPRVECRAALGARANEEAALGRPLSRRRPAYFT